jgi:pimeloyl-ACP methyl ester carboxylesterase
VDLLYVVLATHMAYRLSRVYLSLILLLFIFIIGGLRLLEDLGVDHRDVKLAGDLPATLYMPAASKANHLAQKANRGFPAVLLVHGYSLDRQMMSVLARRLTRNGYSVLTIDLRGHGDNHNPFPAQLAPMSDDVGSAVRYLRQQPMIDPAKIVLIGHSLGASVIMDYVQHDPLILGVVVLSSPIQIVPGHLRNILFVHTQNESGLPQDVPTLKAGEPVIGVRPVTNRPHSTHHRVTKVEQVWITGTNHLEIIYSRAATSAVLRWLDQLCVKRRTAPIDLDSPRLKASAFALALFLVLLIPLGRICGSLASSQPTWADVACGSTGILIVGGAMLASLLIEKLHPGGSNPTDRFFATAGAILLALPITWKNIEWAGRSRLSKTLLVASAALVIVYFVLSLMSVTFDDLWLSNNRAMIAVHGTLCLLPFWIGFEYLLRRGSLGISTFAASSGRVVVMLMILFGFGTGIVPSVPVMIVPVLPLLLLMLEVFAAAVYSASRNRLLIAMFDSACLAWMAAVIKPLVL